MSGSINCASCLMICAFGFDQCLADAGLYESQEEAVLREEVLGKLDQVEHLFLPCSL